VSERFTEWRQSRILALAVGLAAILVGASLTLKPFSSLDALTAFIAASLVLAGIGEAMSARESSGLWGALGGVVLVVTGLLALVYPDATVRTIAIVVGIGLVVSGLTKLGSVLRGTVEERYVSGVSGLSGIVLGVLALSWPDATILLLALLVGPLAVIFGIGQAIRALANRLTPRPDPAGTASLNRSFGRRAFRVLRVTGSLILALILVGVSAFLHDGSSGVDAFYKAPDGLPSTPGQLLRSEDFTRGIPAGSRAKRILFTTTALDGSIGVASALVVVPDTGTAWPVVLWTHGTTGIAERCAPTILEDPLGSGAMPAQQAVIDNGWAIIAPDYLGLGSQGPHPYLIGVPEATSSLDAVRAARQIAELPLGQSIVVWGHSQGGGAALWVGIEAATYAPDVPLAGVAAMAPASDLPALAVAMQQSKVGMLFGTFIVKAYSQVYPDVSFNDYIRSSAREVADAVAGRCLSDRSTLLSVAAMLPGEQIFSEDATAGALGVRLAENTPNAPTGLPTLLGQGAADELILPDVQRAFVNSLCVAGQPVDYRTYAGRDHIGVVAEDSPMIPDLIEWTKARFAGEPPPTECSVMEK
jgi:uncharacterized membrane protein HdeD (DUF308 family)/alpha-beta hydrolase superfamily lysophospholipase